MWIDAERVEPPLSARQVHLLKLLYEADGQFVDRIAIVNTVWSDVAAEGVSDGAVATLIKRLRARLGDDETDLAHIDVVRSRGLRLVKRP